MKTAKTYPNVLTLPLLALVAGAGCSSITTGQLAAPPGTAADAVANQEKILFISNRDGDQEVYLMNTASGAVSQLTNNSYDDFEASWSPDGKQVLFTARPGGNPDIYVINADGSGLKRLTDHPGLDSSPQWSPDGKKIAFISDRDRHTNVYVMSSDGADVINISKTETAAMRPLWSPDGTVVAFAHTNSPKRKNIMLALPDGSKRWRLTDNQKSNDFDMAWSPDGSKIAFASERNRPINIYVIDRDGNNEKKLTDTQWIDASPVWSHDGKKIAFLSTRDDGTRRQLYAINADGTNEQRLSQSGAEESDINWATDDRSIFHVSYRDGNAELYQTSFNGATESRLTNNSAFDLMPLPMPTGALSIAIPFSETINNKTFLADAVAIYQPPHSMKTGRIEK